MTQAFYWTGAHDAGYNDTYVWVGTGNILPDNSTSWQSGQPSHGANDCVSIDKVIENCLPRTVRVHTTLYLKLPKSDEQQVQERMKFLFYRCRMSNFIKP